MVYAVHHYRMERLIVSADLRLARWAGIFYLATFITSFPALALKTPLLTGEDAPQLAAWGLTLEILLAFSCVATSIALLPIARRINESLAFAFVASRTIEAAIIMAGVMSVMALIRLDAPGPVADALIELHDATFLLGPAFMSAMNAMLLGAIMLRGRLVPRAIPTIGLIGGPLLLLSSFGVVVGLWEQTGAVGAVAALPVALWELSLGLWLVTRGVRTSPVAASARGSRGGLLPGQATR